MTKFRATADLFDSYGDRLESCATQLLNYGGRTQFEGPIATLRTYEDNAVLREIVHEAGDGKVLVVDAGASLRTAVLGDQLAEVAATKGWSGLVIYGAVRDVAALRELSIGIKALGSNPRKSRKEGAGSRGNTLSFGGALFTPGRKLVADDDGIVVLPEALSASH